MTISIRRFYETIVWKILMRNNGQEVSTTHLENLWEKLRETLKKQGYEVDGMNMPHVRALVLEPAEYARIGRIVDRLPKTTSNTIEEYGRDYSTESAIGTVVQPPGSENEYVIFLSKSRCESDILAAGGTVVSSESYYLCHELIHVWEHLLNLKPAGSLAKELFSDKNFVGHILVQK